MRAVSSLLVLLTLSAAAGAASAADQPKPGPLAVGDAFPRLQGQFLTGRKAELPTAAADKWALILMGFTYDSRFPVEAWAKEFRAAIGGRSDVTFFEVPMLGGMARMGRWFIDSGMRRGTPKALHEHVITVYGGTGPWKTAVGFTEARKHDAYLVLIGPDGRVRWLYRGAYSESAMGELRAAMTDPAISPEGERGRAEPLPYRFGDILPRISPTF